MLFTFNKSAVEAEYAGNDLLAVTRWFSSSRHGWKIPTVLFYLWKVGKEKQIPRMPLPQSEVKSGILAELYCPITYHSYLLQDVITPRPWPLRSSSLLRHSCLEPAPIVITTQPADADLEHAGRLTRTGTYQVNTFMFERNLSSDRYIQFIPSNCIYCSLISPNIYNEGTLSVLFSN